MAKKTEPKCYICGNTKHKLILSNGVDYEYGVEGEFNFFKCVKCGLIQQQPTPSTKELQRFYPAGYHSYQRPSNYLFTKLSRLNLNRRLKRYAELIGPGGKVLDIGCGDGEIIEAMSKKGAYDCYGIEINKDIAKQGQQKNLKIYAGSFEECDAFKDDFFDLIIVNHLIEHVTDPEALLKKAWQCLKPGGWMIGETPNTDSYGRKILKGKWSGYHVPRHIHLFSDANLSFLFGKTGFSVIDIKKSLNPGHWALSLQNLYLHQRRATRLKNGKAWIYPLCLLAALPITLFENIFRTRSDIIYFEVRK